MEHSQSLAVYRQACEAATLKARDALAAVTRLVVEKDGVFTEFWADAWDVHVQDGGRTVKLFARGDGVGAARTAACSDPAINAAIQHRFGHFTIPGA